MGEGRSSAKDPDPGQANGANPTAGLISEAVPRVALSAVSATLHPETGRARKSRHGRAHLVKIGRAANDHTRIGTGGIGHQERRARREHALMNSDPIVITEIDTGISRVLRGTGPVNPRSKVKDEAPNRDSIDPGEMPRGEIGRGRAARVLAQGILAVDSEAVSNPRGDPRAMLKRDHEGDAQITATDPDICIATTAPLVECKLRPRIEVQ